MHSSSEITFTFLISECVNHTPLHRDHYVHRSAKTRLVIVVEYTIQCRYRKGPRDTRRTVCAIALHLKTKTNTNPVLTVTDTGGAVLTLMLGYRSLYITWQ